MGGPCHAAWGEGSISSFLCSLLSLRQWAGPESGPAPFTGEAGSQEEGARPAQTQDCREPRTLRDPALVSRLWI